VNDYIENNIVVNSKRPLDIYLVTLVHLVFLVRSVRSSYVRPFIPHGDTRAIWCFTLETLCPVLKRHGFPQTALSIARGMPRTLFDADNMDILFLFKGVLYK